VIAVFFAWLLLPEFNSLVGRHLQLTFEPGFIIKLLIMASVVGILAGLYPAFVLSGYNPVVVLKGNFTGNAHGSWLRNGLVIFQFMISIVLIACTIIIRDQIHFMQSKKLGFEKDNVLMIERAWDLEKQDVFMNEVRKLPDVRGAGGVSSPLGTRQFGGIILKPVGSDKVLNVKTLAMDDDFASMIGFTLVEGRGFSKESVDSSFLLLNETAVKTFGLKDPVGLKLTRTVGSETWSFTVIGVVKDFHFKSLRDPITPLVIESSERDGGGTNYIGVRLSGINMSKTIHDIEAIWKKLAPQKSFAYYFLDENMILQYAAEHRSRNLFSAFSILAIVIGCVGLFALSAYTAMLRKKEIGIRKVLGASVKAVTILSKEFTFLVLIAFMLAAPLAWWMMNQWLIEFSYRISLGIGPFIFAGATALFIALVTVSYQSIKAALENPIRALKAE
jgi:putative ABC transport system permease protein